MKCKTPPTEDPALWGAGANKVNERAECIQLVKGPKSHRCVISLCQAHCRGSQEEWVVGGGWWVAGAGAGAGWGSLEVIQNKKSDGVSSQSRYTAPLMHSVTSCAFHELLGCART